MSATTRRLPPVHVVLSRARLPSLAEEVGHELVTDAVRQALADARERTLAGAPALDADELADRAERIIAEWLAPRPRRLLNATGIVLHTNLGRAPVSAAAGAAMRQAATGYSDLEYDLAAGRRGSRHDLVAPLLCRLTGAEAALVVNNNAGATLLILSALAAGREVVVSRGQLVEIGGGYRIPSILAASGAVLVEVGTTNRTHPRDYTEAIGPSTALVLRVHTSNFRIVGFAAEVPLAGLVEIARASGLVLVDDLGSGSLLDTAAHGLASEPTVGDSLRTGADLVCFSGDKLLGGPQAGIVVGRADLIAVLRASPLARALRPGKSTLAGLQATLLHYARGRATTEVPVWRMIAAGAGEIAARAAAWHRRVAEQGHACALVDGESAVGGGSLPGSTLPTTLLALPCPKPDALAAALRAAPEPVVARVADDAVLLDPRTILPDDDDTLVASVLEALATGAGTGSTV